MRAYRVPDYCTPKDLETFLEIFKHETGHNPARITGGAIVHLMDTPDYWEACWGVHYIRYQGRNIRVDDALLGPDNILKIYSERDVTIQEII